jgi:excisionase family DNA binding protein
MIRIAEVAKMLDCSIHWVYNLTSKGILKHYKPNNKTVYFEVADIEAYMRQGAVSGSIEREAKATKIIGGK